MKLTLNLSLPEKSKEIEHYSLEQKCEDYMWMCKSDENSEYHWKYLKAVYNKLSKTPRIPDHLLNLLEKLEKFMLEYGMTDSGSHVDLDSANMFRYKKD